MIFYKGNEIYLHFFMLVLFLKILVVFSLVLLTITKRIPLLIKWTIHTWCTSLKLQFLRSASEPCVSLLLRKALTNAHVDKSWIHSHDERHVMRGWPPQPIQLRTRGIGDGDNVHSFSDFCSADSASDLSWLQSCELCSWLSCLSFKLEAGEKREEGRESKARGMIKRGSCAQGDSPANRQTYWKCKEGGVSLKSHGTLRPIIGQWLHGQ